MGETGDDPVEKPSPENLEEEDERCGRKEENDGFLPLARRQAMEGQGREQEKEPSVEDGVQENGEEAARYNTLETCFPKIRDRLPEGFRRHRPVGIDISFSQGTSFRREGRRLLAPGCPQDRRKTSEQPLARSFQVEGTIEGWFAFGQSLHQVEIDVPIGKRPDIGDDVRSQGERTIVLLVRFVVDASFEITSRATTVSPDAVEDIRGGMGLDGREAIDGGRSLVSCTRGRHARPMGRQT